MRRKLLNNSGCGKYIGRFYVRGSGAAPFFIDGDSEEELRALNYHNDCDLMIVEVKNLDPHENGRLKRTSVGSYMQNAILSNIFEDNYKRED